MYDRIPSPGKENRVSITQDNGQVITGVLAYADDATQEGSAYTKGNVLPDSVLSLIGLPTESSEPADMFNVLATAGDLHVWRRTVTTEEGIDPSYNLGNDRTSVKITNETSSYNASITITYGDSVSVSMNGDVSIDSPQTKLMSTNPASNSPISGPKFFSITSASNLSLLSGIRMNTTYYIPGGYSLRLSGNNPFYFEADKLQDVTGVPGSPPGTYTDYPVSVNPNAYQVGDDVQPAGYTLGEVQNGQFVLSNKSNSTWPMSWNYADSVSVSDDGSVTLVNPSSVEITGNMSPQSAQTAVAAMEGKFVKTTGNLSDFNGDFVYFFPSGISATANGSQVSINQYQPVTGYPAIPARTTIEYLGKLGDKARIVTGSYVGTGTYGSGSPNSLTLPINPRMLIVFDPRPGSNANCLCIMTDGFGITQEQSVPYGLNYVSLGELTSWYSSQSQNVQMNLAIQYQYIAIG